MKILVIRFSSLGDVVLTSPVVRCVKEQLIDVELFFLTKPGCVPLLKYNPYIDHIVELQDDLRKTIEEIRGYDIDCIVDLHNNHRSRIVRSSLGCRSYVYGKENFHKFLYVLTKQDFMSGRHVVDRYFETVKSIGVHNDGKGLDCYLPEELRTEIGERRTEKPKVPYVAVACGAQHYTKQMPVDKIAQMCSLIESPVLLLGDKSDALRITSHNSDWTGNVVNLCGETSLMQSAALVRDSAVVVTPDSAMMHLAAAFKRPTIAVWGGTTPTFGFSSYGTLHWDYVVKGLRCHPCSRMGKEKCPRGHLKCMMEQDWNGIARKVNETIKNEEGC